MLTVRETARELVITEARVRAMLSHGILEGEKAGRMWLVHERSIARRLSEKPSAGRPRKQKAQAAPNPPAIDAKAARRLYEECEELLAGCYDSRGSSFTRTGLPSGRARP